MIEQIITANHYKTRKVFQKEGNDFLNISEFYYDTIQGEGIYIGHPAAFLRLQRCTMGCVYCDTKSVWQHGSPFTFNELFSLMEDTNILYQLKHGQHLVFTGGSPLLQQDKIVAFLEAFEETYEFLPFVEIENECTIIPTYELITYVSCWNNSPKLVSSGMPTTVRFQEAVIKVLAKLPNSWFKFVVSKQEEWDEIDSFYLHTLLKKEQIILMPEGATRIELENNREVVIEMAVTNGVRYCSREHIVLWDRRIGV